MRIPMPFRRGGPQGGKSPESAPAQGQGQEKPRPRALTPEEIAQKQEAGRLREIAAASDDPDTAINEGAKPALEAAAHETGGAPLSEGAKQWGLPSNPFEVGHTEATRAALGQRLTPEDTESVMARYHKPESERAATIADQGAAAKSFASEQARAGEPGVRFPNTSSRLAGRAAGLPEPSTPLEPFVRQSGPAPLGSLAQKIADRLHESGLDLSKGGKTGPGGNSFVPMNARGGAGGRGPDLAAQGLPLGSAASSGEGDTPPGEDKPAEAAEPEAATPEPSEQPPVAAGGVGGGEKPSVEPPAPPAPEQEPEWQGRLSPEATDLLQKVDGGGVPAYMTESLRRIAKAHGIEVTDSTSPNDVIAALRSRTAAPAPQPESIEPGGREQPPSGDEAGISADTIKQLPPDEFVKLIEDDLEAAGEYLRTLARVYPMDAEKNADQLKGLKEKLLRGGPDVSARDEAQVVEGIGDLLIKKGRKAVDMKELNVILSKYPEMRVALADKMEQSDLAKQLREKYPSGWEKMIKYAKGKPGWLMILILLLVGGAFGAMKQSLGRVGSEHTV